MSDNLDVVMGEIKSTINNEIKSINGNIKELNEQILDLAQKQDSMPAYEMKAAQTLSRKFIASDGFKALREGARDSGKVTLPMEFKALTSLQGSAEATPVGIDVQATRVNGLFGATLKPTRLYQALTAVPVSSNALTFTRLANFSNSADYQNGEATAKAEQNFQPTLVTAPIATVAVWHKASEQVLDDEVGLSVAIDNLLRAQVLEKIEHELINGDGNPHHISGLLNEAEAFTATSTAAADKVGETIAAMQGEGYTPDLVCISPSDWFQIRSERATGNEYVANGWVSTGEQAIYDVPVVVCSSLAAGTVIVVDSNYVNLLDRMAPTVLMSSEDGNNFTQNLVTIRAEMRIGLAVYDTKAVKKVSLA